MPPRGRSGASDGIPSLLEAVRTHKKFKQLACYSIDCVTKVIGPPHVGWEENVDECVSLNAAADVVEVLKLHPGHEGVLLACTQCLARLGVDKGTADLIAEAGGVQAALASIAANPEMTEGVAETMELVESVTQHKSSMETIVASGGIDAVLGVVQSHSDDMSIMSVCMSALERMSKSGDGLATIAGGGIAPMLAVLQTAISSELVDEGSTEMARSIFKTMLRVCRADPSYAEAVRNAGGTDIIVAALEFFKDDEQLCKLGGRLLTAVAGGDMDSILAMLGRQGLSDADVEKYMMLLSSLALDESNTDGIVRSGGVAALIAAFNSGNSKAAESSARTLARLATSAENIDAIVQSGAIETLVGAIGAADGDASAAATAALMALANSGENVDKIHEAGGISAVLGSVTANPDGESAGDAFKFIDTLVGGDDFDADHLVQSGGLQAIVAGMGANGEDADIQAAGTRALIAMSNSADHLSSLMQQGGVGMVCSNAASDAPSVSLNSLTLLSSMAMVDINSVCAAGGVEAVVAAVAAHPGDRDVRGAAAQVMGQLSSAEVLVSTVEAMKASSASLAGDLSNRAKAEEMARYISNVGAFAMSATNVEALIDSGVMTTLVTTLETVSLEGDCPLQEEILTACSRALTEMSYAEAFGADSDAAAGAARAVINSIKVNGKLVGHVGQSVQLMAGMAAVGELGNVIVEAGGIETCCQAMRANLDDSAIAAASAATLLQVSSAEHRAVAVAQRGGTRQIISCLTRNAGKKEFAQPTEQMLKVLQVVANDAEGREIVLKQGGIDAILATMAAYADDEAIMEACRRALARLVTEADVRAIIEELRAFTPERIAQNNHEDLQTLADTITKLASLAGVGDFGELIAAEAAQLLIDILRAANDLPDSKEKVAVITATIRALGQSAGGSGGLQNADVIVPLVLQALEQAQSPGAVIDILQCIKAILSDPAALAALVAQGCIEKLLPIMQANSQNSELMAAGFDAMAAMCATADGAARFAAAGGIEFTCDWLRDNMDSATAAAVAAALRVLYETSKHDAHLDALQQQGAVQIVADAQTVFCVQESGDVGVMTASLLLLGSLARRADFAAEMMDSGLVSRIVHTMDAHMDVYSAADCVEAMLNLLIALSQHPGYAERLEAMGAINMILKAMDANEDNAALLELCGQALTVVSGGNLAAALQQPLRAVCDMIASLSEANAADLAQALRMLGHFMLVDGAVDQATAETIVAQLIHAVDVLLAMPKSAAQQKALAACLSTLAKVASVKNVAVDSASIVLAASRVMGTGGMDEGPLVAALRCAGAHARAPEALVAMAQNGVIEQVSYYANEDNKHPPKVIAEALKTLDVIGEMLSQNASVLLQDEAGARALAAMLGAMTDARKLQQLIYSITSQDGGLQALLGVLEHSTSDMLTGMIVKTLKEMRDVHGALVHVYTEGQVGAIRRANDKHPLACTLLESACETHGGCYLVSENDGIPALLAGVKNPDAAVATLCAAMLAKIVSHNDATINARLQSDLAAPACVEGLNMPRDEQFQQSAIYVLRSMVDTVGAANMGLDKDALRILTRVVGDSTNQYVKEAGTALLTALTALFADAGSAQLGQQFASLDPLIQGGIDIVALDAGDGRTYYFNRTTQETMWEKPESYAALSAAIENLAALAETLGEDNVMSINANSLTAAATLIGTHTRDVDLLTNLSRTLAKLAANDDNANAMARAPNLATLVDAMQLHHDKPGLLTNCATLLDAFSRTEDLKQALSMLERIRIINDTIMRNIENELLVEKCLSAFANLAFNSPPNMAFIVEVGGIRSFEKAMQVYPSQPRLLEVALCGLSNLMYQNIDNKKLVCDICGDEIVNIIRVHHADKKLFIMALRALGNLSVADENVIKIVKWQATNVIVLGMEAHFDDEEVLQVACEVIGNFASLDDEDDEDEERPEPEDNVYEIIASEGGIGVIVEVMRHLSLSAAVLVSGMDALGNLANDEAAADEMVDLGVAELIISVLQTHDWDEELVDRTVRLMGVITYSENALEQLSGLEAAVILFSTIEAHSHSSEFLINAFIALSNIAIDENSRRQIAELSGIAQVLHLMEAHSDEVEFLGNAVQTLTRLAVDDDLSQNIAESGMHVLMSTIQTHFEDPALLAASIALLGQLAFVARNLKIIVQHGGISHIITAIASHPEERHLMLKAIQTLDNISMADEEYTAIVVENGGQECIQEIQSAYEGDDEIVALAQSALVSFSAMRQSKEKDSHTSRAALLARLGQQAGEEETARWDLNAADPISEFRSMLTSGQVVTEYVAGAPRPRHAFIASDFQSIVLKDTRKGSKSGVRLALRQVRTIEKGAGPGHSKRGLLRSGKSQVNADCAFSIVCAQETIWVEAKSPADCERWVDALDCLLFVFRGAPSKLRR